MDLSIFKTSQFNEETSDVIAIKMQMKRDVFLMVEFFIPNDHSLHVYSICFHLYEVRDKMLWSGVDVWFCSCE